VSWGMSRFGAAGRRRQRRPGVGPALFQAVPGVRRVLSAWHHGSSRTTSDHNASSTSIREEAVVWRRGSCDGRDTTVSGLPHLRRSGPRVTQKLDVSGCCYTAIFFPNQPHVIFNTVLVKSGHRDRDT
jgi:hypothetical protein